MPCHGKGREVHWRWKTALRIYSLHEADSRDFGKAQTATEFLGDVELLGVTIVRGLLAVALRLFLAHFDQLLIDRVERRFEVIHLLLRSPEVS